MQSDRATSTVGGYWMVGDDGGVFSFGSAPFFGSLPGLGVSASDIVGVVPTADGKGYWLVGRDGGVFAFGDARYLGSLPELGIAVEDIVGVVPTSDDNGYWMVGADGGVFAFGDATFVGSLPGLGIAVDDVVAVIPTHDDLGYLMIGSDGGVFVFGDAAYSGSLPGLGIPVDNIIGAASTSRGSGYWLAGSDGGIFTFGDAPFLGSLPGLGVQVDDIAGIVGTGDDAGFWLVGKDGGVFGFGDAPFLGSLPSLAVQVSNIVAFAPEMGGGQNVGQTSITTSLSAGMFVGTNITVASGTPVTDDATLDGAGTDAGGTVTYRVYSDANCSNLVEDAGTVNVTGGVVPASNAAILNNSGGSPVTYYWRASYSGDAKNAAANSACGGEIETVNGMPPVTGEIPWAVLLPVAALLIVGLWLIFVRRRSQRSIP